MSSSVFHLDRHSVKPLLNQTFFNTLENIILHLSNFLKQKEPESLHQYRINIRMARSMCIEFGAFMNKKYKNSVNTLLRTLQKETNEMRDIDVFLAYIEAYKQRVDSSFLGEFESIKAKLIAEKEVAYKAFESKYTEAFFADTLAKLQLLQNNKKLCFPKSEHKLMKYLKEIFEARLDKIAKISKKLTLDAPNALFHKLRLHYKKLRYTSDALSLEAFSKSFKPIQNAFGDIQDKNSQIERIKRYNTIKNKYLEHIIALLEEELVHDKSVCIEISSPKTVRKMRKDIQKIFTCKGQ